MNIRDLEYLVALHEHRHFGRAAEASFCSQPTLSTQIRKLEGELGIDLVERGSRQVLFTEIGERVVRRARRILAEAGEIRFVLIDPPGKAVVRSASDALVSEVISRSCQGA